MNRRIIATLLTAVTVLVIFAAGAFLYQRSEPQAAAKQTAAPLDLGAMVRDHSPVIGHPEATTTIVEYFDPACEACRAFHPYVKQLLAAYPRDVRLVVRYVSFHPESSGVAVQILEAARKQQRFEPVLDALLQSQHLWANHASPAPARAWDYAQAAGLDLEQARAYIATGAVDAVLQQDTADYQAMGVRATPTFFVNGKRLLAPDPKVLGEMVKEEVDRLNE